MTTEQITEALAVWDTPPKQQTWEDDHAIGNAISALAQAARDHLTCLQATGERVWWCDFEKRAEMQPPNYCTLPTTDNHKRCGWHLLGPVGDWVSCPTCNGSGRVMLKVLVIGENETMPCPDCVGGLQPSAELVERVARGIGFLDFDLPFEFCLRAAWAALLASRQGDTP